MRSTFKTLFYINRQKVKADGSCPIMGRITIDRKVSQYYTGEDINPALWDVKTGRVLIKGGNAKDKQMLKDINIRLDELEQQAQVAYKTIVDAIGYVSAEMVRNAVTGRAQAKETLIALMDEHNDEYAK
ncbi:MAG: hypothetical protein LBS55_11620 [Prevotellaceae bacterium]|jgi:hypothetical protein|nr:hypothetical protein [Prevotellaceae bacterium]